MAGKLALEDEDESSASSDDDGRVKEQKTCDLEDDVIKLSIGSENKKPLITELD